MLSVPSRAKLLVKPALSVGSAANVENVTTPYVIREFVADTPGMAAIATGRTIVSLPNTAASVSPRRSSIASTSSTSFVLGSTSTETKMSVSGNRSFRSDGVRRSIAVRVDEDLVLVRRRRCPPRPLGRDGEVRQAVGKRVGADRRQLRRVGRRADVLQVGGPLVARVDAARRHRPAAVGQRAARRLQLEPGHERGDRGEAAALAELGAAQREQSRLHDPVRHPERRSLGHGRVRSWCRVDRHAQRGLSGAREQHPSARVGHVVARERVLRPRHRRVDRSS